MSAMKLDLGNPRLLAAAKALSPGAALRVGGPEGDVVCYDVPEFNSTCASMNQTDPSACATSNVMHRLTCDCDECCDDSPAERNFVPPPRGSERQLADVECLLAR